ncbi:MAG: LicD family protein [Prevotella sp.]|jgi:lipopolysaccharide cholinephosphotransferase|nr:LicD family protein [Prevotella sp.]
MVRYNLDKNPNVGVENELKEEWIKRVIGVLRFIIKVCENNNLRYYAAAGTTIGAVRHHGFIPWDDDVDIQMPRKDYDKFLSIMSSMKNSPYKIIYPQINSDYYLQFAKVYDDKATLLERNDQRCLIGPFVDVFSKDGCPDNDGKTEELFTKYHYYQGFWNNSVEYWNSKEYIHQFFSLKWKYLIKHTLCHVFKIPIRKWAFKGMHNIESLYDYDKSNNVITWCGLNKCEKEIHLREWFGSGVNVQFEDLKIKIPTNFDAYLKCMYGNYMQLPPKEDQVSHHYVAYLNLEKRETIEEVLAKLKHKK